MKKENEKTLEDIISFLKEESEEELSNIERIIIERIADEITIIKENEKKRKKYEQIDFHTEYENEELAVVLITKDVNEEVYFDCAYTRRKHRRKGLAKGLFKKVYEGRKYKKAYGYPVTEGSKKIMRSFSFFEVLKFEDRVWVNKNYFDE